MFLSTSMLEKFRFQKSGNLYRLSFSQIIYFENTNREPKFEDRKQLFFLTTKLGKAKTIFRLFQNACISCHVRVAKPLGYRGLNKKEKMASGTEKGPDRKDTIRGKV